MDGQNELTQENQLFQKGIQAFNERRFYDAHEYWEELWLDHKLEDAKFIQGLIQLAVSYFHLFNQNIKGSRSMIRKCLGKFEGFDKPRGIDVDELNKALICWEDFRLGTEYDLYCKYISFELMDGDDDYQLSAEIELAGQNNTSGGNQTNPFVYATNHNTFLIAWEDSRNDVYTDIYFQELIVLELKDHQRFYRVLKTN